MGDSLLQIWDLAVAIKAPCININVNQWKRCKTKGKRKGYTQS